MEHLVHNNNPIGLLLCGRENRTRGDKLYKLLVILRV